MENITQFKELAIYIYENYNIKKQRPSFKIYIDI